MASERNDCTDSDRWGGKDAKATLTKLCVPFCHLETTNLHREKSFEAAFALDMTPKYV